MTEKHGKLLRTNVRIEKLQRKSHSVLISQERNVNKFFYLILYLRVKICDWFNIGLKCERKF